jgi:hypothetical protein
MRTLAKFIILSLLLILSSAACAQPDRAIFWVLNRMYGLNQPTPNILAINLKLIDPTYVVCTQNGPIPRAAGQNLDFVCPLHNNYIRRVTAQMTVILQYGNKLSKLTCHYYNAPSKTNLIWDKYITVNPNAVLLLSKNGKEHCFIAFSRNN